MGVECLSIGREIGYGLEIDEVQVENRPDERQRESSDSNAVCKEVKETVGSVQMKVTPE